MEIFKLWLAYPQEVYNNINSKVGKFNSCLMQLNIILCFRSTPSFLEISRYLKFWTRIDFLVIITHNYKLSMKSRR